VIQEALTSAGYEPLGFFSFTPIGLICIVVGIIVLLPLSKIFLYKDKEAKKSKNSNTKSLDELAAEYNLNKDLRRYRITSQSAIKNKTLAELDMRSKFGLTIVEIRNEKADKSGILKNIRQSLAGPDSILSADDIVYITGDTNMMDKFAEENRLEMLDNNNIDFYDIGIAEIVLMPTSRLIGYKIINAGFREKYSINILGIKRSDNYIRDGLTDIKLQAGDVLLVQGKWSNISELDNEENDWVVLGQPEKQASQVTLNYKAPLAAIIMISMIAMMVFDFIPVAPVTAVIIAGLLMVLLGCFRNVESAYKTINWESIVLIAAMMPMSTALEKTGTSAMISQSLVSALGSMGPMVLLAGIYFTTSLLTMFISNTATAVLMAPIAMTSATQIGASPYPFLFAVTLGASMCFASPFATPPNALVMKAGEYKFSDYIKVGLPLQIMIGVIMTFVLPLIFPF
jgi:di/tricarboxylate transporter